jgi:DivIVA domain-containing protein
MLLVLTTIIEVLAVLAVLFVAGALATRETDLLVEAPTDDPDVDLPVGPLQPEDIAALRFGMVLRGYRMREVDETLRRVAGELTARDERIAALEQALVDVVEPQLAEVEQRLASPGVVLDAAADASVAAPPAELPAELPAYLPLPVLPDAPLPEPVGDSAEPEDAGVRTAPEEPAPVPVPAPTSPAREEPMPNPITVMTEAPFAEPAPMVEPEAPFSEPTPLAEPVPLVEPEAPFGEPAPLVEPPPLVEPTPLAEPEPQHLHAPAPPARVSPTGLVLPTTSSVPHEELAAPHWPQPAAEPEPEKLAEEVSAEGVDDASAPPADDSAFSQPVAPAEADDAFPEIPTGDDRA